MQGALNVTSWNEFLIARNAVVVYGQDAVNLEVTRLQ